MKRPAIGQLWLLVLFFASFGMAMPGPLHSFEASGPRSIGEKGIGKVDLLAVLSFHPRMALFNTEARAFYRLEIQDLFRSDLEARLEAIRGQVASAPVASEPSTLEWNLQEIERRRHEWLQILDTSTDPAEQVRAERELAALAEKMTAAGHRAAETAFHQRYPQFSSPDETDRIFRQMEREVQEAIDEVARERDLIAVLNQSTPLVASCPTLAEIPPVPPESASRLATSLYFAFLSGGSSTTEMLDRHAADARHPQTMGRLSLRPWPLVLSGGEDLTVEVLEKVLRRNAVPEDRSRAIVSFLREILAEVR